MGMKFNKYCSRSICKEIAKQKCARTFYFILSSFLYFNYSSHSILFQMHSKVLRKSCTLQSGPPSSSSTQLTPYIVMILLNMFPMLPFISMWLFCNYQFVLLNPFTFFIQFPKPPPSANCESVLCIYSMSLSILFVG